MSLTTPEQPPDTAVILAGGLGNRLLPLTVNCPKPLVLVNQVPFLRYLLAPLKSAGFKRVVVLTGYLSEQFETHFALHPVTGLECQIIQGELDWDTGKRLSEALSQLPQRFMLLYADNYWPVPMQDMWHHYLHCHKPNLCTVFRNRGGSAEYGAQNNVYYDPQSFEIQAYNNEQRQHHFNGVDMGFFIVDKHTVPESVAEDYSLKHWMQTCIENKTLAAYATDEQYYFITSPYLKIMFEHFVTLKQIAHV